MDKIIESLTSQPVAEPNANVPTVMIQTGKFAGQVVVITGGAQGIGRVTSLLFAAQGANVVLLDRDDQKSQELLGLLEQAGTTAAYYNCDVSNEDSVQQSISSIISKFGKIDVLVHLAGIVPWHPLETYPSEVYKRVLNVSMDGCFFLTRAVLPHMKNVGYGRIINISSNTIQLPAPGLSAYIAAKAAIIGFTRSTSAEAGPGVTANTVVPGLIRTENTWDAKKDDPATQALFDMAVGRQTIKRPGLPTDIAYMISFLASPEAQFITGQLFDVGGGATYH
jgi:NAD(P)-dependent dehydrogenase (short-subunit alcohol dehydrogenase family)